MQDSTTGEGAVTEATEAAIEAAGAGEAASESASSIDWSNLDATQAMALVEDYGFPVLKVLVILVLAWIVSGWAKRLVSASMRRASVDETLTKFFGSMARWLVLVLALITVLSVFGVETTSFAAVLGAAGLAIGLAFQGSLSNVASGVMLLTFRPFKVGDVVSAAGVTGKVDEIGLFATTLDTPDNRRIILPNSAVFGGTIENVTFHATRRVDVAVGTDYSADLDRTREVLRQAIASVPGVLADPEPVVYLSELGGSSIDWAVRAWAKTEDYWAVREQLTRAVKVHLDEAGIGIPFPQMDVHVDGGLTQG